MAALSSLPHVHRHGTVYHEQDESSSSGEFLAGGAGGTVRPPSSDLPPRCRTADSEDSYEEIYSSSASEEESYHSECDDIAEYWDPYCKPGAREGWDYGCTGNVGIQSIQPPFIATPFFY